MNRRQLIRGIGSALCAGALPPFLPRLIIPEITSGFAIQYMIAGRQYGKSHMVAEQMAAYHKIITHNFKEMGKQIWKVEPYA